jgi:hypothetical protein
MLADLAQKEATRYVVNAEFNRAFLLFSDGSSLEFEHTSRTNRWARASADGTSADRICRAMHQFRLNAKHLQLFFEDGSDAEFVATSSYLLTERAGRDGKSR